VTRLRSGDQRPYSQNGRSLTFKQLAAKISENHLDPSRAAVGGPEGFDHRLRRPLPTGGRPETGKVTTLCYTPSRRWQGRAPELWKGRCKGAVRDRLGIERKYFFDAKDQMRNASFLDYRMPTSLTCR
jgi:hypothetical protein